MIDIEFLIALCKVALADGSKMVEAFRKRKLIREEKELLIAASEKGEFRFLSADQTSETWVRVGAKDFCDNKDPSYAAIYLDAFRSLCERGYIAYESGILFKLTGSGFKRARELAKG